MTTQIELFKFSGSDYVPKLDKKRLSNQLHDIKELMSDGKWRTLSEIDKHFDGRYPQASLSANLRNLRKSPFNLTVEKRRTQGEKSGLFEYRIKI